MSPFIQTFAQFLIFYLFWIILSGRLDKLSLLLGLVSALCVLVLNRKKILKKNISTVDYFIFWKNILFYSPWLSWQIFLASFHVIKIILSPKMNLNAGFKQYKSSLSSDVLKVIFANTITLTPGTITADITDNTYTIYTMDSESAESILNGDMEKKIFNQFKLGEMR